MNVPMVFYTYLNIKGDGIIRYVGKGVCRRPRIKERDPHDPTLFQEWPTKQAMLMAEKILIDCYGKEVKG